VPAHGVLIEPIALLAGRYQTATTEPVYRQPDRSRGAEVMDRIFG
jgi:hypothetical protein